MEDRQIEIYMGDLNKIENIASRTFFYSGALFKLFWKSKVRSISNLRVRIQLHWNVLGGLQSFHTAKLYVFFQRPSENCAIGFEKRSFRTHSEVRKKKLSIYGRVSNDWR